MANARRPQADPKPEQTTVTVRHPVIPDWHVTVPASRADEWTAAGWLES